MKSITKNFRSKIKLPKIIRPKLNFGSIQKFQVFKNIRKLFFITIFIGISALIGFTTFSKFGDLLYPVKFQVLGVFTPNEVDNDFRFLNDQIISLNEKLENSYCVQAKYIEQNLIQTQNGIISKLPNSILSFSDNPDTPENEAYEKKIYGNTDYFQKLIESLSKVKFDNTNCFALEQIADFVDVYYAMDTYLNYKTNLIDSKITSLKNNFDEHKKILDANMIEDQFQIDLLLELLAIAKRDFINVANEEIYSDFEKYFNTFLILEQANEDFELGLNPETKYTNLSETRTRSICLLFSFSQEECQKEYLDGYWNSINEIESPADKVVKSVESLKVLEVFR